MKYKILITSIIVLSVTIPALTGYSVVQFINDSNTYTTINMVLGIIMSIAYLTLLITYWKEIDKRSKENETDVCR
jgi:hypothetical protein